MYPNAPDPNSAPSAAPAPSNETSPEELLSTMLQLATVYLHSDGPDQGDRLKVEKARTLIQQILADGQSAQDSMLGGNARALRRLGI